VSTYGDLRRGDDLYGQQRAYGLKKLLRLDQRNVGLGVINVGSAAVTSAALPVG
jgi:hypothetical protein